MLGFEVEINGERSCLAGVAEFGVLTAILSWVRTPEMIAKEGAEAKKLELHVGGLTESNGGQAHVTWLNKDLLVGDEVRIRIVDTDHCDTPGRIEQVDPNADLKMRREYYERLKSEFESD